MTRSDKPNRTRLTAWDPVEHLDTPEMIVGYLNAAFAEHDPALVAAAIGDIARAQGMGKVATAAGFGRESLYKALSLEGNPALGTVLRVLAALGYELRAVPREAQSPRGGRQQARVAESGTTGPTYAQKRPARRGARKR